MPRLVLLLPALLALACAEADPTPPPASPPTDLPFEDVTDTHLPDVRGPSMDARPADLDGDGNLDVVVAMEFDENVLLLNDGSGRFTDASDRFPRTRRDSEDIAIADFDGDGDLDVVFVSEDDQVNEYYLNDGTARFTDVSERLPVRGTTNAVLTADLDGDGRPDLLLGNNGQNTLLLNDGAGGFTDATAERLPNMNDSTQDLELGDVDGDGDLDLVVGNENANRLLLNDGTGRFADAPLPLRDAPEETREADLGDVDGDSDLDILFANINAFTPGADPQNRLLLNDGTGTFTDATAERLPALDARAFDGDFVDLDGDGDLDILTSETGARASIAAPYRVLRNDGTGRFTDATAEIFPASAVGKGFDAEAADFNGDGRLDLYLAGRSSQDRLLLGR